MYLYFIDSAKIYAIRDICKQDQYRISQTYLNVYIWYCGISRSVLGSGIGIIIVECARKNRKSKSIDSDPLSDIEI